MTQTIKERLNALPNPSRRKLTLFACSCVREVWHLLEDERSKQAIIAAEKYADGLISKEEMHKAINAAYTAYAAAYAVWSASYDDAAAALAASYAAVAAAAAADAADASFVASAADAAAASFVASAADAAASAAADAADAANKEQAIGRQHQLFDDIFGS